MLVALLLIPLASVAVSQSRATKPDSPKAAYATRIGLVTPRVNLIGGGSVSQETTALHKSISSFLTGPRMETVDLRAMLDSLALEEGKERDCDYVLYVSLVRKRQSTGRSVSYGSGTKAGDQFVFEYKLIAVDGKQQPVTKVLNATASADGDDVLTPIIETAAQTIVGLARSAKPAPPPGAQAKVNVDTVPASKDTGREKTADNQTGYGSLLAGPQRHGPAITKDAPKAEGAIRIGMATPRITVTGNSMGGSNEATSLRSTLSSYFSGSTIETIDLSARLDVLALNEGQKRECDFVLYITLMRKRNSSSGGGSLNSIVGSTAGGAGSKLPGSKVANDITSEAARVGSTIATFSRTNDEITFEYKLVTSAGGREVVAKVTKAKVKKDGEDVLTPMLESAAQAILDATLKK
jgi:hypothetical protein